MLRRRSSLTYQHLLVSDSKTDSNDLSEIYRAQTRCINKRGKLVAKECRKRKRNNKIKSKEDDSGSAKALKEDPGVVLNLAQDYQEHMHQFSVPTLRRSKAIFITWHALVKSMEQFYNQPLHYMTHVLVKQWDQSRIGTMDEEKPMNNFIHSRKAESTIWDVEAIHRGFTSHIHLAKLCLSAPGYHAFVNDRGYPLI